MECLDLRKYFEDPNPALFKSDTGYAISFFLTIKEGALKRTLTKLIWDYGGRVETSYDSLRPRTILLVDCDSYRPNYYDRIEFGTYYVVDCIMKNSLLPLNPYSYARKISEPAKYFYDVVYYRTRVFKCVDKMDAFEKIFTLLVSAPSNIQTLDELADDTQMGEQPGVAECALCKCTCKFDEGASASSVCRSEMRQSELDETRSIKTEVDEATSELGSPRQSKKSSDSSRSPSPKERLNRDADE